MGMGSRWLMRNGGNRVRLGFGGHWFNPWPLMIMMAVAGAFWKVPVIACVVAGVLFTLWVMLALYGRKLDNRPNARARTQTQASKQAKLTARYAKRDARRRPAVQRPLR